MIYSTKIQRFPGVGGLGHPLGRTQPPLLFRQPRSSTVVCSEASSQDIADLWQYKDRKGWYEAKFAADDQPDWQPATFISLLDKGPAMKELTLEVECSRELVPLRNAYKHIGQYAQIRVNGGQEMTLAPTNGPVSPVSIRKSLLRVRNDLAAGEQKVEIDPVTERKRFAFLVGAEEAPDVFKSGISDLFEIGPFVGNGLDYGDIQAVFRYPTIVLFVNNAGIATARSLITSDVDVLQGDLRESIHMYYKAPNKASMCFQEEFDDWKEQYGVHVFTSTRDTFQDMFDEDETLMYTPEGTAAIILTGKDADEDEDEALEACKASDINTIVQQTVDRMPTEYLSSVGEMN
jgi:hypothetical protein